jgi:Ohr subfamily peroxiredoxin
MSTNTQTRPAAKVLFTGKTFNNAGSNGGARSADGFLDIRMSQPHPAAENLFGAAWSACYMGAIELVAAQRQVKLLAPPEVDTEIDLVKDGSSFYLQARLQVALPWIERELAQQLIDAAHDVCPYSKAVHGNIQVTTTLV